MERDNTVQIVLNPPQCDEMFEDTEEKMKLEEYDCELKTNNAIILCHQAKLIRYSPVFAKHFSRKDAEKKICLIAEAKNVYDLIEILYDGSKDVEKERQMQIIELSKYLGISLTVNEKKDPDDARDNYDENLIPEIAMSESDESSDKNKQFEVLSEEQQQNEFLTRFSLTRTSKDKEDEDEKPKTPERNQQTFYYVNTRSSDPGTSAANPSQNSVQITMPKSATTEWANDQRERPLRRTVPVSYKDMQSPPKTSSKPYVQKCKHCSNFFRNIQLHQKSCTSNPMRVKYNCEFCWAPFTRKENVVRHQQMSCNRRPLQ